MLGLSLRGAWAGPAAIAPGVLDGRDDVAAAYGTRRLLSAWGLGPAFDLVRVSDSATTTVSFDAAGNPTVVSGGGTLDAWLGSGTARVSRWYDQTGKGNHATQATTANQPGMVLASRIGPAPSIIFNGQYISDTSPGGGANFKWLAIPDTLTGLTSTSLTMLAVVRSLAFNRQGGIVQLHQATRASNTPPVNLVRASSDQSVGLVGYGPNGVNWSQYGPSNRQMLLTPQAVAFAAAPTAAGYYVQHWDGANAPNGGGSFSSVALAGGLIGAWQSNPTLLPAVGASSGFAGEIGAVVVLNQAISSAAATALRNALTDDFGATPAFTSGIGALLFNGDSITEGTGSTFGRTLPRRVEQLGLGVAPRIYAGGRYAGTVATNLKAMWAYYTALAVAGARNVMLLSAGTNDIASGATAATVFGSDDTVSTAPDTIRRMVASGRAQGWTMLVGTLIGRGNLTAAYQTERTSLNSMIRDGAATYGYTVVDYAGIPQLAANPTTGNAWYLTDLIHPNDAGYALMAPVAQAAINAAFA